MAASHDRLDLAPPSPLQRRTIEAELAATFLNVLTGRLGTDQAQDILGEVVDDLAQSAAATLRDAYPEPTLADLWSVWGELGGGGRLDLHLDELTATRLSFHVDRCAYAEMYRAQGQEELGVAFSCRRDGPFAEALIHGVRVEQSDTLLQGSSRCEFTYTLEQR